MSAAPRRSSFLAGLLIGAALALVGAAVVLELREEEDASLSDQARAIIEAKYFEEVPRKELQRASVRGMVRELRERYDDRFSHYFAPKDLRAFNAATSGEFSGVGLSVSEVPRGLRVASVFPDTPAARADIAEGDLIVAVNGKSIEGVPAEISTARIKGEPGTEVRLRIEPAADGKPRAVTLERASVRIPAAEGNLRRAAGRPVGYVRYSSFSKGAHGELREEIERLRARGARGIVLDLRGNGGGLLNEAILSASLFVEDGEVVTTRSRADGETVYDAVGDALEPAPLVVLVNRDTASAAEILAAAIQVYELGEIVGTRSFGKGTFQEVIHLPAGGALDLTIGEYVTADGTSLADKGVRPDMRAADDRATERDEALRKALRVLAGRLG